MGNKNSIIPVITYLFGAGASANVIPLMSGLPTALNEMEEMIRKGLKLMNYEKELGSYKIELHKRLMSDFSWLAEQTEGQVSVDTYAKKLFLRPELEDYKRLKRTLTFFFIIYQLTNKGYRIDKRYDFFFAGLIEKDSGLPLNLNVITWNYDSQFEISYEGFADTGRGVSAGQAGYLDIFPRFNEKGELLQEYLKDLGSFQGFPVIKLNGIADFFDLRKQSRFLLHARDSFTAQKYAYLLQIYEAYDSLMPQFRDLIFFSWDKKDYNKYALEQAKKILNSTNILVIIGYSFPFFNRRYDREILRSHSPALLKRIYIQDKKENIPNILTRLKSYIHISDQVEITEWPDLDAFCIPFEY